MLRHIAVALMLGFALTTSSAIADESTKASPERMAEWNDWKFGMFIHWGAWAQMERGAIWDIRGFEGEEEKAAFELYKTFNPVKYDPDEWAAVAKAAGMKYAVLVTKHHDGFCNYDTKQTEFAVTNPECPYSKADEPDLVKQYVDAIRKAGLKVGLYYSHIDWHHPDGAWNSVHPKYDKDFITKYPDRWKNFVAFEKEQVRELLTNYGEIDEFWFDISWGKGGPDALPMLKMMRELQPNLIIDNRGTRNTAAGFDYCDFVTPEQHIPGRPPEEPFEVCMTISNGRGFWYKGDDTTYKPPRELVEKLADIASKGGNFLLNIGPSHDGSLHPAEVESLMGVGKWMDVNSEAIYGTTSSPWGKAPEWGRVTRKGQRLYLIVFDRPDDGKLPLALAKRQTGKATLVGSKTKVEASAEGDGVALDLSSVPESEMPFVIAVDVKGDLNIEAVWPKQAPKGKGKAGTKKPKNTAPIEADANGVFNLPPERATCNGTRLMYQASKKNLGAWLSAADYASFKIKSAKATKVRVEITYGVTKTNTFEVAVGESKVQAKTENTKTLTTYKSFEVGEIELPKGESELTVKVVGKLDFALMNYRGITLTPVE